MSRRRGAARGPRAVGTRTWLVVAAVALGALGLGAAPVPATASVARPVLTAGESSRSVTPSSSGSSSHSTAADSTAADEQPAAGAAVPESLSSDPDPGDGSAQSRGAARSAAAPPTRRGRPTRIPATPSATPVPVPPVTGSATPPATPLETPPATGLPIAPVVPGPAPGALPEPHIVPSFADGLQGRRLQLPRAQVSVPVRSDVDGCNRDYGTVAQCIPTALPGGQADLCRYLAARGIRNVVSRGADRQRIDRNRNGIVCD